jgi:hypothetical protein
VVLVYEQDHEKLEARKFEPLWRGPYIVSYTLQKGAYELVDYEGNPFPDPHNGLYLKNYMLE